MDGYLALALAHNRRAPAHHFFGADITDKTTIERFQRFVVALPRSKQLADFQPMIKALSTQKNAYGILGPTTRKAATAFNKEYGWSTDEDKITAGTLEAMRRPDLQPNAADAAREASDKAAAVSAANEAATKAQEAATAAKVVAATTPSAAPAAQAAQVAADNAKAAAVQAAAAPSATAATAAATAATDETKAAASSATTAAAAAPNTAAAISATAAAGAAHETAAKADTQIQAASQNFLTRKYGGIPVWGIGLLGTGALAGIGLIIRGLLPHKVSP